MSAVQTGLSKIDLIDQIQYITPQEVEKYIRQAGRSSQEIKDFVQWITSSFKRSLDKAQHLWMGYEIPNEEPVIVAMVDKFQDDFPATVGKFKVLQRVKEKVSDEGRLVILREIKKGLTFSSDEQHSIKRCLAVHAPKLITAHSNLSVISASKIKSVNHGRKNASYDEILCIVLYVSVKGIMPVHEEIFPGELDGIQVDVREGTFKAFGKSPQEYHERLKMGCQIQTAYNLGGTLGGFLQLENKCLACLTCAHVFYTDESIADFNKDIEGATFLKKDVYQPEPGSDYKIGHMTKIVKYSGGDKNIGVDAALIEITEHKRYPETGSFPDATSPLTGFSPDSPMVYNSGEVITCLDDVPVPCNVVKFGASTGHTVGLLRLFGTSVHALTTSFNSKDKVRLHHQFEVFSIDGQPFADEGDSGSLVFVLPDLKTGKRIQALGLLAGGTEYKTTIVTPIWAVLEKFNLPLKLLQFEMDLSLPKDERLDRVEQDVGVLKRNVSELVVRASNTEQKMTLMDTKIDQLSSQATTTEQKIDQIGLQTKTTEQGMQQMLTLQQQLLTKRN